MLPPQIRRSRQFHPVYVSELQTPLSQGHHGDTSSMFLCGDSVSPEARRLCAVTKAALDAAIAECGPGVRFSRIGAAVSKLAKREKCGSARACMPSLESHRVHAGRMLTSCAKPAACWERPSCSLDACGDRLCTVYCCIWPLSVHTLGHAILKTSPCYSAITSTYARRQSCCCRVGVVPLFCGHGVGKVFHASPAVMHTPNGEPDVMHVRALLALRHACCDTALWPAAINARRVKPVHVSAACPARALLLIAWLPVVTHVSASSVADACVLVPRCRSGRRSR